MLSHASNLFVEADRKGEMFSLGAFECLLREFILKPVPYIGCSEHSREFIADLVIDFVTKFFKAKAREIKEKHLERSSSKGKSETKKGKLATPSSDELCALENAN